MMVGFIKITDAAITFLGELHERFGRTVMAAYNTGPSRLSKVSPRNM